MKFGDFPTCQFCGAKSDKLCDGKLADGRTCDKRICGAHARTVAFLSLDPGKSGGRRHDTRDLCPECITLGRSAR